MPEIVMRREGNHLVPVDELGVDDVRLIPAGKDVMVTARAARNIRHHRLAWVLATKVAEACDFLHDKVDGMDWLKIKSRHVKMLQDPRTGQVAIIPKSIAFASLSQQDFARIFDRMIYVTCNEIIPGLDEGSLRAEIESVVGIKGAE